MGTPARARYLVFFQYAGTDFNGVAAVRGAQRAVGVQDYLEEAAARLKSEAPVRLTVSSRTDAGVHALCNAAHLDVQRRPGRPPFPPSVLAQALNRHLRHPAIRVLRAFRVPGDFHARHAATSRTYLYRLATGCARSDQLPVFERSRCWALGADTLDLEAMQEAARHLLGTHDFSAFQSAGSPALSSLRTLRRACVGPAPASPYLLPQESRYTEGTPPHHPAHLTPLHGLDLVRVPRRLQFWNLEFESRSFLYRQVRRMTAVLVAVGLGRLSPLQVKSILESRDPLGKQQSRVAPAHGLFLKSVLYGDIGALSEAPDIWVHTPHEASKVTSPLEVSPLGLPPATQSWAQVKAERTSMDTGVWSHKQSSVLFVLEMGQTLLKNKGGGDGEIAWR